MALDNHRPGARWHAVDEEGVPVRQIAEVIGAGLGVPVKALSVDKAAEHFGWLAGFAAMDLQASSTLTRDRLGWKPTGPGLLEDLRTWITGCGEGRAIAGMQHLVRPGAFAAAPGQPFRKPQIHRRIRSVLCFPGGGHNQARKCPGKLPGFGRSAVQLSRPRSAASQFSNGRRKVGCLSSSPAMARRVYVARPDTRRRLRIRSSARRLAWPCSMVTRMLFRKITDLRCANDRASQARSSSVRRRR